MKFRNHVKYSMPIAVILFFTHGFTSLFFIIGAVFIDVDHFIEYSVKARDFSIKRMFVFYDRLFDKFKNQYYLGISPFHTIEFLLLIAAIGLYSEAARFILVGMIYHHILDGIYLQSHRCFFKRSYSIFHYLYLTIVSPNKEFLQMQFEEKKIIENLKRKSY